MLTYTDEDGFPEVNGYLSYSDDASYSIRNCGEGCHVLIHLSEQSHNMIETPDESEERVLTLAVSCFVFMGD